MQDDKPKFDSLESAPEVTEAQAEEYARRACHMLETIGAVQFVLSVGYGSPKGDKGGMVTIGSSTNKFLVEAASEMGKKAMTIMLESGLMPKGFKLPDGFNGKPDKDKPL